MTAAVIPAPSVNPFPTPGRTEAGYADAAHPGGRTGQHRQPGPYLMPVPDCEPPFDDDLVGGRRPRASRSFVTVSDTSRDAALVDGARLGAVCGQAQRLGPDPARPDGSPDAEIGADPLEPAPVRSSDRRDSTAALSRVPGQRRSAGSGRRAKSGVLLLEPSPPGQPRTITSAGVPSWSSEADIGVRKTTSEHLPPVGRAASVLARALVEVLSGQRPLAQLRVHCAPEIYAGLGERPTIVPTALPHLLTVRVCEPADGVAEVSAAFRRSERVRALAFRVEGVDGRWRITALQLG